MQAHVVIVTRGEGEDEGGEGRDQLTSATDQALATAFALNSVSPHVAAKASTLASGSTRRLWREKCAVFK
jgi:hypothetical protein